MSTCVTCHGAMNEYTVSSHICVTRKICDRCHVEKATSFFSVHASSFDGYRHTCTACLDTKKEQQQVEKQARHERRQQENALFKAHGYRWRKIEVETFEGDSEEVWQLFTPRGKPISTGDALIEIEKFTHPSAPQGDSIGVGEWARELVKKQPLILDTETTGFDDNAEVIELAVVDLAGEILLDTLIRCEGVIPFHASRVHGITQEMLQGAPLLPVVWTRFRKIVTSKDVVIFNASFDTRLLSNTASRYGLSLPSLNAHCLMLKYAEYVGEIGRSGDILYQKLARACAEFSIETTSHRALGDAEAARQVLLHLASI